ncbi:MAG: hypothetical protein V4574_13005 [Pseudomonadota bacterium]
MTDHGGAASAPSPKWGTFAWIFGSPDRNTVLRRVAGFAVVVLLAQIAGTATARWFKGRPVTFDEADFMVMAFPIVVLIGIGWFFTPKWPR